MNCFFFCYRHLSPKKVLAKFVKNGQREKSTMTPSTILLDVFNRSHLNHSFIRIRRMLNNDLTVAPYIHK